MNLHSELRDGHRVPGVRMRLGVGSALDDVLNQTFGTEGQGGKEAFQGLGQGGIRNLKLGFDEINRLLQQRGTVDPRMLEQRLSRISRFGEQGQRSIAAQGAQAGLGGSGVLQALQAARGVSTQQMQAGAVAEEQRAREERFRGDLQLLLALTGMGGQLGAPRRNEGRDAIIAAGSTLLGGVAGGFGGGRGGGGGGGGTLPS